MMVMMMRMMTTMVLTKLYKDANQLPDANSYRCNFNTNRFSLQATIAATTITMAPATEHTITTILIFPVNYKCKKSKLKQSVTATQLKQQNKKMLLLWQHDAIM